MRAEMVKDHAAQNDEFKVFVITGSEVVFYDNMSGRFFKSEMVKVQQAINEINFQINNFYHASLNDFYEKLGLGRTEYGEEVGWNSDALLEVKFAASIQDDKPVIGMSFYTTPVRGYDRCH